MKTSMRRMKFPVSAPNLGALTAFAVAFVIAYRFGMSFTQEIAAPFWFPDSVLLCALLLSPPSTWWQYIALTVPVRLFLIVSPGMPSWYVVACLINDSSKALLSAWLLGKVSRTPAWLESLRDFILYFLIAVLLAPSLSAFAAAPLRAYLGDGFWTAWRNWFLGDALASLMLTPLLVCLMTERRWYRRLSVKQYIGAACIVVGLTGGGYLAFHGASLSQQNPAFFWYLPVPFLLWAAVRFGPLGASGGLSLITLVAIFATLSGGAHFDADAAAAVLFSIQLVLFCAAVPFMFLSVLSNQQRKTAVSLRESEQKLRQLSSQLIHAQETERFRIGQELHDDLSQRAAALAMGLSHLSRKYRHNETLTAEFDRMRQHAMDLCIDIARLSHQLHPTTLEKLGLPVAVRSLCEQLNGDGRAVIFECDGDLPQLASPVSVSLYRIAQESLRNALAHSGATHVAVELRASNERVSLTIKDTGCGFIVDSTAPGLGLSGMAERMRTGGGSLNVLSSPGIGTTVTATVPILKSMKAGK